MRALPGNMGIGHVRYPTAGFGLQLRRGAALLRQFAFGIVLGHNGNLTNTQQLQEEMFRLDRRHINTNLIPKCCSMCWRTSCRPAPMAASNRCG